MPRGLDHIVHAVRDLDAAVARYRELGFTVGARNKHPWGTHNHIVQFPGFFIELLTLAEPDRLTGDLFSTKFGVFNGNFAARHDGLSMLVLESANSAADADAFAAARIAASASTRFDREGRRPDGANVHVAFSLAFAVDSAAPDIGFFTCQQHFPENFWNPAFQLHANGATAITEAIIVAEEPFRHRDFLLAFAGVAAAVAEAGGFRIALPRAAIRIMTPAAYTARSGLAAPATATGPRLAALEFNAPGPARSVPALGAGLIFVPPH